MKQNVIKETSNFLAWKSLNSHRKQIFIFAR